MRKQYNLQTEISLVLLPTLTMAGVLLLLRQQPSHLLFASLASSAFLIYVDPHHPANQIFTLVISQVFAALAGTVVLKIIGAGYTSAVIAMCISIIFMVLLNVMHPPAVSTALTFAFTNGKTLSLFLIALGFLVVLVILQKTSLWLIARSKTPSSHKQNQS